MINNTMFVQKQLYTSYIDIDISLRDLQKFTNPGSNPGHDNTLKYLNWIFISD